MEFEGKNYDDGDDLLYFDTIDTVLSFKELEILCKTDKYCHLLKGLTNFTWNKIIPKTLVCHDHRGGYLEYERHF